MSWLCPTCGREVALWEAECPHCTATPPQESLQSEPGAAASEAAHAHAAAESPENSRAPAPRKQAGRGSIRGAFASKRPVPWVAYVVMGLALVALTILLWPRDQISLRVETEPSGAMVLLDDQRVGETPLEVGGLTPGYRYTLRVELEGYKPFQQEFLAQPQATPWAITLERGHDALLDEQVVRELVEQIGESGRETLFSHELAEALFTVNPLIEQNPWLTERTWTQIFQEVVKTNFDGDSQEFLHHLRTYKAELARGKTSKQVWYQHLHECEKVCRPVVTEVFKRHIEWLRRSGFAVTYFPLNQHRLTEEDGARIRQFIQEHKLVRDRTRQVLLVGRASRLGGQQYNLELSRKRVEAVTQALAAELPDGRTRLRQTYLGFEPPQISPAVAEFLGLDAALSEQQLNQSVMLIVSEPLPAPRHPA